MWRLEFAFVISCWVSTVITVILWVLGSLSPVSAALSGAVLGFLYPFVVLPYQGPTFGEGDRMSRFQLFLYPALPDFLLCVLPPVAMILANAEAALLGMLGGYFAYRAYAQITDDNEI